VLKVGRLWFFSVSFRGNNSFKRGFIQINYKVLKSESFTSILNN